MPALVGLCGTTQFLQSWCNVRSKVEEERKKFANYDRGIIFEPVAANHFQQMSGLNLNESPFVHHQRHPEIFGASPDRTFVSDQFFLKYIDGTLTPIAGNFILEIKTRALGGAKPLQAVTAAHVVQCQWQMCCMPEITAAVLMSYHPEMKTFTLFLINRNEMFISALETTYKALRSNTEPKYALPHAADDTFASQLSFIKGNIDFQAILPLRQWAGFIAKETVEVFL